MPAEYPQNCTLLVDTYNVLKSGVPNAIRVFNEVLVPQGWPSGGHPHRQRRHYLSFPQGKKDAGRRRIPDCKICASNSLDEYIILRDMLMQGAKVDSLGVGERLITSSSEPVFGGVYKLAAVERRTEYHSQDQNQRECRKDHHALALRGVWRIFDTGKAIAGNHAER